MAEIVIGAAYLAEPQLLDLLRSHLAGMHANSPPGRVFALDLVQRISGDAPQDEARARRTARPSLECSGFWLQWRNSNGFGNIIRIGPAR